MAETKWQKNQRNTVRTRTAGSSATGEGVSALYPVVNVESEVCKKARRFKVTLHAFEGAKHGKRTRISYFTA